MQELTLFSCAEMGDLAGDIKRAVTVQELNLPTSIRVTILFYKNFIAQFKVHFRRKSGKMSKEYTEYKEKW
jgi:hypothetical protein